MSRAECATFKSWAESKGIALPANPCYLVRYMYAVNYQALMPGETTAIPTGVGPRSASVNGATTNVVAASAPAYWRWSYRVAVTDILGGNLWKLTLSMNGVANGQNVYQWYTNCTPSGFNTSIQWCGYQYNGGGAPTYGMLFGLNGQVCGVAIGPVGVLCYNHGIRQWIDDRGNPTTEYDW